MLYAEIFYKHGDIIANIVMAVMLCVGSVVTGIIGSDLRRQAASQASKA